MNISLRQVKMNPFQTVFITSTGTLLFTSYTRCDPRGYRSTTVITSVDDQGSTIEVCLIKWNSSTGGLPLLCIGNSPMELRTIWRDGCLSTIFRGSDRRLYAWKGTKNIVTLAADIASGTQIAVVCDDPPSSSTVDSTILYVQPTGFHLLHEIVATFIVFEHLCGKSRVNYSVTSSIASNPCRSQILAINSVPVVQNSNKHATFPGTCILSGEPHIQLTKGSHWTREHVPPTRLLGGQDGTKRLGIPYLTHSTADLTGQLLRRHKYPSAYGGFGDIWKCDWLKDSRVIEVAVKVMRTNLTGGHKGTESKRISRELKVWVRLEHECVLPLYGISFDFGKFPAMVCPWVEGGTLSKYLERHEGLKLQTRLQLLSDIADGLHYLHGCGIVHGDLTGSNVLIKDNGRACLSDFGLSRIFMETTGSSYLTSTVRGSVRWAAPELFEIGEEQEKESIQVIPSTQSDIYSLGSTMLQLLTGKIPFHYYKNDAQVLVALSRGLRPTRPDEPPIDDDHWEFMQKCWASWSKCVDKNVRPSIEEVVDFLSVAKMRSSPPEVTRNC